MKARDSSLQGIDPDGLLRVRLKEKGRAFTGKARPYFTSASSRGAGAERTDQPPAQAPQAGSAAPQAGSAAAQVGSAQPAVAAQPGSQQLLALALARRLNKPRRARRWRGCELQVGAAAQAGSAAAHAGSAAPQPGSAAPQAGSAQLSQPPWLAAETVSAATRPMTAKAKHKETNLGIRIMTFS
jgi:hypothetical protein